MATTNSHARRFLALVDPDFQILEAYRSYYQTTPRKTNDEDFQAWCLARIKQLCGATSFVEASERNEFVTLLAVGFIDRTRGPRLSSQRISQSMRVPAAVSKLEPDFFPVLLQETTALAAVSPTFSANLEKAKQWIWQTVASLKAASDPPQPAKSSAQAAPPDGTDALNAILGFLVISAFVGWVKETVSKD